MRTKEGKAQITAMTDGLGGLEKLLLGNGGLFAAHREALAIHAEATGLQQSAATREAGYIQALESARKLVEQRNDVAKTKAEEAVAQALPIIGEIVILGILLAVLVGLVFANRIVGPLQRLTSAMTSLAEGVLDTAVPERERRDEIGNMVTALQVFKDNAVETQRLVAEREQEQGGKEQRGRRLAELCADHETSVTVPLDTLQHAAADMSVTSQAMSQVITETGEQASAVVVAVDGATANVQSVAAAAEELSSSVAGVNERIGHSAQIARKAADEASRADEMVSALSGTATEIGDVLRMIQDIANQTNLLALNATIEAARAGEAGRGFAVVASEVKGLAGQTAKSAGEIAERISAIQNATSQVAGAIGGDQGDDQRDAGNLRCGREHDGRSARRHRADRAQHATGRQRDHRSEGECRRRERKRDHDRRCRRQGGGSGRRPHRAGEDAALRHQPVPQRDPRGLTGASQPRPATALCITGSRRG